MAVPSFLRSFAGKRDILVIFESSIACRWSLLSARGYTAPTQSRIKVANVCFSVAGLCRRSTGTVYLAARICGGETGRGGGLRRYKDGDLELGSLFHHRERWGSVEPLFSFAAASHTPHFTPAWVHQLDCSM